MPNWGRRSARGTGCLAALVVLIGLVVAADRVADAYAERQISRRIAASLDARAVGVDVEGFPFLTQALRRRFDRIDVRAEQLRAGELAITRAEATLLGVRPSQGLRSARAARLSGSGDVGYADITAAVDRRGVTVHYGGGDEVAVRGAVEVLGREIGVTAYGGVAAVGGDTIAVRAVRLETGVGLVDDALERLAGDRLDFDVPVDGLPEGIRLDRVAATPRGLRVFLSGAEVLLEAG
jgi:LmeA-like phospholipid-binding